jgi:predicted nucleic acid-binding protein
MPIFFDSNILIYVFSNDTARRMNCDPLFAENLSHG